MGRRCVRVSPSAGRFASLSTFASVFEVLALLLGLGAAFGGFAAFVALTDGDAVAALAYGSLVLSAFVGALSLYALAILFRCVLETYRNTETLLARSAGAGEGEPRV